MFGRFDSYPRNYLFIMDDLNKAINLALKLIRATKVIYDVVHCKCGSYDPKPRTLITKNDNVVWEYNKD